MTDLHRPVSALLLLAALLAAGTRADGVTTTECKARGRWEPVRRYPVDSNAYFLDMTSCNLTGIQQHELTGLPALRLLFLSQNSLRELPVFDVHVCANLTSLELHCNQLTEISNAETFSACAKLMGLHLDNNKIEHIHANVFSSLANLRVLYLNANKMRWIPDQMFASNGKLTQIYLNDNRISYLPPEFASRRKRAGTAIDVFYFHDNPWHCACLLELLADVRRAGVRDYKYFYTRADAGRVPECRFIGAVPCSQPTGLLRAAWGGHCVAH